MSREKIEQRLSETKEKIKVIDTKYQDRKKALEKSYASEVKTLKEKEKFLTSKLKEIDNKEKIDLVSNISMETLKKAIANIEHQNAEITAGNVTATLKNDIKEDNKINETE